MGEKLLTIDRFEGAWAVLDYEGEIFNVPKTLLPEGAKEGDVLVGSFEIDGEASENRRRKVEQRFRKLFED